MRAHALFLASLPLLVASVSALPVPSAARAREQNPDEVVARLERALESALAQPDFAARRELLAPVVAETHDARALARRLAGEDFESAAEAERAELAAAVSELAASIYAARFDGPAGAVFQRGPQQAPAGERALVLSSFPAERGAPRRLELSLSRGENGQSRGESGWRIVDFVEPGGGGFDELRSAAAAAGRAGAAALAAELRARAARIAETPSAVVQRLQAAILEALRRADELGYAGRYALLAPVVADTHDLDAVTRLVVSEAWRGLGEGERKSLVETFRELSVATYAARFDSWAGQSFGAPEEREVQRGAVQVMTLFHRAEGRTVHFEYLLRRTDGRFEILNIVVDGVSDLALKKTEYGDLIESKGLAALVARLREQIARYAAGEAD